MKGDSLHKYVSNSDGWARELTLMFILGAVAASFFWLAVWYVQAKPAQADALQEKTATVQELDGSLQQCTVEKERLTASNARLESEAEEMDRQLKQAWAAHARCVREEK
jgi:hypothetical protein